MKFCLQLHVKYTKQNQCVVLLMQVIVLSLTHIHVRMHTHTHTCTDVRTHRVKNFDYNCMYNFTHT